LLELTDMTQSVKVAAVAAVVILLIAVGVMWKISSQNTGPRPGIDIPLRGM
jgi:hypothetical protein